jgi:hypothetical protein
MPTAPPGVLLVVVPNTFILHRGLTSFSHGGTVQLAPRHSSSIDSSTSPVRCVGFAPQVPNHKPTPASFQEPFPCVNFVIELFLHFLAVSTVASQSGRKENKVVGRLALGRCSPCSGPWRRRWVTVTPNLFCLSKRLHAPWLSRPKGRPRG